MEELTDSLGSRILLTARLAAEKHLESEALAKIGGTDCRVTDDPSVVSGPPTVVHRQQSSKDH